MSHLQERLSIAQVAHLVRRFLASLAPAPLSDAEEKWLDDVLTPQERRLFDAMPRGDRRHALDVTFRLDRLLVGSRERGRRPWVLAALFHDVGKTASALGVPGRVAATVLAVGCGRDTIAAWATRPGPERRFGLYLDHPAIGQRMILEAGAPADAARWALVHQTDTADAPGMPGRVRRALLDADDD